MKPESRNELLERGKHPPRAVDARSLPLLPQSLIPAEARRAQALYRAFGLCLGKRHGIDDFREPRDSRAYGPVAARHLLRTRLVHWFSLQHFRLERPCEQVKGDQGGQLPPPGHALERRNSSPESGLF